MLYQPHCQGRLPHVYDCAAAVIRGVRGLLNADTCFKVGDLNCQASGSSRVLVRGLRTLIDTVADVSVTRQRMYVTHVPTLQYDPIQ
jgi:hypothetical protein